MHYSAAEFAETGSEQFRSEFSSAGHANPKGHPLPRDARYLLVRETLGCWQTKRGVYNIDWHTQSDAPAITREEILQRAATFIVAEVSTAHVWLAMTARLPLNQLTPAFPAGAVGGMNNAWMSMASLELTENQVFVLTLPALPTCRYFGVVLMDWWQRSIDPSNKITSLNTSQLQPNANGEISIVTPAHPIG